MRVVCFPLKEKGLTAAEKGLCVCELHYISSSFSWGFWAQARHLVDAVQPTGYSAIQRFRGICRPSYTEFMAFFTPAENQSTSAPVHAPWVGAAGIQQVSAAVPVPRVRLARQLYTLWLASDIRGDSWAPYKASAWATRACDWSCSGCRSIWASGLHSTWSFPCVCIAVPC